ncbi:evolutionarily conserved signaling intermediate in Toll pathway, mitochondrial [Coturnix japonica]|uniref:evolutionarily conserved signaling intermediate in Toll pathway, mitochondrial n=1 Tax=Coturnix japonica TaxID=93934 RepID=UPI0013A5E378|nr:evolutionarily conserved signaling intermediate in Toll pathway, mitochondrial [Coturnix japonica]
MSHRSADAPDPPPHPGPGSTPHNEDQEDQEEQDGPKTFAAALSELERSPGRRMGRLELVAAALAAMPAMGVARQLDAYNRLLRLLPQGPWVPRGALHRLFAPFPRQQECGLQVLEQMERYGVMPNAETRFLLLSIFGPRSRPVRKCQRMLYWLPRMKHANPHPLPAQLPPPGLAAACLGLRRIANDLSATISIYQVGGVTWGGQREDIGDKGWGVMGANLAKWIAGLQETNPVLGQTPVIFRLGEGDSAAGDPGDGDELNLEGEGTAKLEPPEEEAGAQSTGGGGEGGAGGRGSGGRGQERGRRGEAAGGRGKKGSEGEPPEGGARKGGGGGAPGGDRGR